MCFLFSRHNLFARCFFSFFCKMIPPNYFSPISIELCDVAAALAKKKKSQVTNKILRATKTSFLKRFLVVKIKK